MSPSSSQLPESEKRQYQRLRQSSRDDTDPMPPYTAMTPGGGPPSATNGGYRRASDDDSNADLDVEGNPGRWHYEHYDGDDDMDDILSPTASSFNRLKHFARRVRRRRPLLLTALTAVLGFSIFLLTAFNTYTHFGPWPGTQSYPIAVPSPPTDHDHKPGALPASARAAEYGEGIVLPDDPTHVLVPVRPLREPAPLLTPPARPPLDVLTDIYVNGVATNSDPTTYEQPQVDLVYLYVNASSPYFGDAKEAKSAEEGLGWEKGQARHYRDNGELRGAIRSGTFALKSGVRRIHLLTGSFDFDHEEHEEVLPSQEEVQSADMADVTRWRMAQVPTWLNWTHRDILHYHVHSDIYRLPRDDDGSLHASLGPMDETTWRKLALPTFNSFQIESRIGWMEGLSDNFIFSNDDMFMRLEHSLSDFHHPVLGNVVRVEPGFMVGPTLDPKLKSTGGEWGGLGNAASLIAARFPSRDREYVHHMPKGLSRHIAHEASVMFAEELSSAATRTFRQSKRGRADVEYAWLMTHLRIERWREALLWSFAVARVGGAEGVWGASARDEFRRVFGMEESGAPTSDGATIRRNPRSTMDDMVNTSAKAGWAAPLRTRYVHSSLDGHMPSKEVLNGKVEKTCTFDFEKCLPPDFFTDGGEEYLADKMFGHMAFREPECGDCLIDALMNASGQRGLSAFLPSEEATYTPEERPRTQWERSEPILPLTPKWEDADFSLAANVRVGQDDPAEAGASVNLRRWSVKLLSRYAYVYSRTPSRFFLIVNTKSMSKSLADLDSHPDVALVCMNDDQPDDANGEVNGMFKAWMEGEFGRESELVKWEKDGPLPW